MGTRGIRRYFAGLIVFAIAVTLVVYWLHGGFRPAASTTRGWPYGSPILIDAPIYKQSDPAWSGERMGRSGETIRSAGCTVCCAAMLMTHYGVPVTPGELNRYLSDAGGYTSSGLLVWEKFVQFAGGRVQRGYDGPPRQDVIEKNLAEHNPVIVKVYIRGRIPHWVLVVGTDGPDYLANDPAGRETTPVKLSRFGSRIYALRVFSRTP